jgi:large subunit ribosomal protein L13
MPSLAAETRVASRTGEARYPSLFGQAMKSYTATPDDIQHDWYIVDAEGMVLGRLATEIARVIRGKHKPMFTPHMDTGDNVIVINASKVKVTGRKAEQKEYFHHTGYMGHERYTPFRTMIAKHPERVIEKAVYGMLPKSALGRQVLRNKLRVYATAEHPHIAQQPKALTFTKSEK